MQVQSVGEVVHRLFWAQHASRCAGARLTPVPALVTDGLLEQGGGCLSAPVRLRCTKVWPTLSQVVTLQQEGFGRLASTESSCAHARAGGYRVEERSPRVRPRGPRLLPGGGIA